MYDVEVLVPGYGALTVQLAREGIRFHSLHSMDCWSIPAIRRLIRIAKVDLVYLNSTSGAMRNCALAALSTGTPYLCHVREMGHSKSWRRLGYLWGARAVIAVSEACANSVKRFVRRGRLHVVHNGVETPSNSRYPEDRGPSHSIAPRIPHDAHIILTAAHVCARKGQEYAIAALPEVLRTAPRTHLCIAGSLDREPDYVEALRTQVRDSDLTDRVHFLGFRSDLSRLYASADLFLHTALSDPHPRAVIEAMSMGLPVVAFATDGVKETVLEGLTGRIVPQRDTVALARAIADLIASPVERARMGQAGQESVAVRFTAAVSAAKVIDVIQSLGLPSSAPKSPSLGTGSGQPRVELQQVQSR